MKATLGLLFMLSEQLTAQAQDINWFQVRSRGKHLTAVTAGADYSSYYAVSYGYVMRNKFRPVVVGTEFQMPFGQDFADDWKWRTSVQAELLKSDWFSVALKPAFVLRRYESPLARMYNMAGELPVLVGYVRPRFGITAMASYDRTFVTHIHHGTLRDDYANIRDGWYGSSGGNFKFGARVNLSGKSWNSFLTLGKHYGQDFRDNPTYPFFAEISIQQMF